MKMKNEDEDEHSNTPENNPAVEKPATQAPLTSSSESSNEETVNRIYRDLKGESFLQPNEAKKVLSCTPISVIDLLAYKYPIF